MELIPDRELKQQYQSAKGIHASDGTYSRQGIETYPVDWLFSYVFDGTYSRKGIAILYRIHFLDLHFHLDIFSA